MPSKFLVRLSIAVLVAIVNFRGNATTFFSDTFGSGSTIDSTTVAAPTAVSTSYETISAKNWSPTPFVTANQLRFGIASTSSGAAEIQALFATNAVALTQVGDYIQLMVVFTNKAGILTASDFLGFGLYNSGQVHPVAGGLNGVATSAYATNLTGGAVNWAGFVGQLAYSGSKAQILTRPPQTNSPTGNNAQDLVTSGSASESYAFPTGTTVGSSITSTNILVNGSVYTEVLNIALITINNNNSLAITNYLYSGANTSGTLLAQFGGLATNATDVANGFDGLAMGWYKKSADISNVMDVASILITGQSTPVSEPPVITTEPGSVSVATNGSCIFTVAATGFNLTYQWHRNGTNLVDGGNISGSASSTLGVNYASLADVAAGANGYYVTVTGTGDLSVNSTTNSLALDEAKNLIWSGTGNVWDLDATANWLDADNNAAVFNYGDAVTFNDTGAGNDVVTLTGSFLSASTFTISGGSAYEFTGSGGFAGTGSLIYNASAGVQMDVINTHSGGTVISNANASLYLELYQGLGSGPLTLAMAGGKMEVVPAGNSSLGIAGDVYVNDSFTIQFDGTGSYAGVFLGNLAGTAGKLLTLSPQSGSTINRYRVYGSATVFNADLNLSDSSILFAPYCAAGSQTYNGVISGPGALIQKGTLTYLNGPNTFTGGLNLAAGVAGLGIDTVGSPDAVTSGPIGTGPLWLMIDSTTSTTGSAQIFASGGAHALGNTIEYPSGTNNLTLVVGGSHELTLAGSFELNGQDGNTAAAITSRTIQVTNTAATIISGVISDSSSVNYGLVKTGSGALYLDGVNTYAGSTTNNSATTNFPGLLAGAGTIAGPVYIQTNSSIGGGSAASIGTLTINNNLTIAGNGWFRLNQALTQPNDEVTVSGTLANAGAGTITVTNLGSAAIAVGGKFTLFSKAVSNGSTLAVTGAGMNWTNLLATDGSIQALSVVTTTASYPTNLTFQYASDALKIGWPATHQGWILQTQTNGLGTGLIAATNAWSDLSNTITGTNYSITVNPANPTVFFRLRHP